jgi:hypothetical protein
VAVSLTNPLLLRAPAVLIGIVLPLREREICYELCQTGGCRLGCWKQKREFIEQHGLVVWRFHDHWHSRTPDGILEGMTRALGWTHFQNPENPHLYTLPATTLRKLAADVAKKLDQAILRIIGDPAEQAGMEDCTSWLKTFVKDVHIEFVATQQPFWTVRAPKQ